MVIIFFSRLANMSALCILGYFEQLLWLYEKEKTWDFEKMKKKYGNKILEKKYRFDCKNGKKYEDNLKWNYGNNYLNNL